MALHAEPMVTRYLGLILAERSEMDRCDSAEVDIALLGSCSGSWFLFWIVA